MSNTVRALLVSVALGFTACGPPSLEDICAKPFMSVLENCEQGLQTELDGCVNPDYVQQCYGDAADLEAMQNCESVCTTMADRINARLREAH